MVRVPAAAPILEALNAGALDVGYTGDLAFLTVYAAGAPIKAIGGTRADARTQAILVRKDSPIETVADLKGKRLAGTRGGWGQFLIDATLEKAGYKTADATFAPLGPGCQDCAGCGLDRRMGCLGAVARPAPGAADVWNGRFAPTAAVQSVLQSTILSSFADNIGIIRQLRRSHHVINSDNVFGTHTWLARGRTMISFTSTSSGCSIANYMLRPMASG
jgi:hypothetical protein